MNIGLMSTYFVELSCVPGIFMAVIGTSGFIALIQFDPSISLSDSSAKAQVLMPPSTNEASASETNLRSFFFMLFFLLEIYLDARISF